MPPYLHDVPNGSWVRVVSTPTKTRVPPDAPNIEDGEILYYDHLDGMYSYCKNLDGQVVHLVAWADVEIVSPPDGDN